MFLLTGIWASVIMSCGHSFTDARNGKTYKTVTIGNQVWMAENLDYDVGDGSFCFMDDNANCDKFGRLYTWDAANKAAPPGWHLPSKDEWETLISSFGGVDSITYAEMVQDGGSGFDAMTAVGSRDEGGAYLTIGKGAYYWSSTPDGDRDAWYCVISRNKHKVHMVSRRLNDAFPIRCIKD